MTANWPLLNHRAMPIGMALMRRVYGTFAIVFNAVAYVAGNACEFYSLVLPRWGFVVP